MNKVFARRDIKERYGKLRHGAYGTSALRNELAQSTVSADLTGDDAGMPGHGKTQHFERRQISM